MRREGYVAEVWETYERPMKQLEIIHRSRIVHRDIREENIPIQVKG